MCGDVHPNPGYGSDTYVCFKWREGSYRAKAAHMPHGSIHVQSALNPFVPTRKEFYAMVAVSGITLSVSVWTTDYTRS